MTIDKFFDFRFFFISSIKSDFKLFRHKFSKFISILNTHITNSSHITNHPFSQKFTKGNHLCNLICSIFINHIINHFSTSVLTKIHINIRHAHTLRI
ncbi:Uncharacterised protein [Campylobacter jejuni]|nr:Uncharacterised protein [Campylobacter jejuni]